MRQHRRTKPTLILLAALALVLSGCASTDGGGNQAVRGSGPASNAADLLSGSYRLQDDNSDLRLEISSTGGVGSTMNLLATASGTYEGRSVSEQGVLTLQTEGRDVRMSVIPHFGEPVTSLSPDVNRFSGTEIQAACTLYLQPYQQGWAGATQGPGTCVQAITGAAGDWQIEIQPGTIRLSDPKTQRTLVFREAAGSTAG